MMTNPSVLLPPASRPPILGLTLGFFKYLVTQHGGRDAFEGLSTADVCFQIVVPFTASTQLSLVDHVHRQVGDQYVKPASWFVSHAWSYAYLDVVDALTAFFDEQDEVVGDDVAVWFCMFNNNQHLVRNQIQPFEFWVDSFQSALKAIKNVVMVLSPWNNPTTLTRMWCVFEIYVAIATDARFEVAMAKTQKQAFLEDIEHDEAHFNKMLGTIKSEQSQTAVASDSDNITRLMQDAKISFTDLDRMLFNVLEDWMIRTLQVQIDGSVSAEKAKWLYVKASVICDKGHYDLAKQCLHDALHIYRSDFHGHNVDMWKAVRIFASIEAAVGQSAPVWEPMFQDALSHQMELLGDDHYDTLLTMLEFGGAYRAYGMLDQAYPLIQECYERCNRVFGDTKEMTLIAMGFIGSCYFQERKYPDAEVVLVECLDRWRRAGGQDSPYSQRTASSVAAVYSKQGKLTAAKDMFEAIYEGRCRTLGVDHEQTWQCFRNLGVMHFKVGQYDASRRILADCLDSSSRLHQSKHHQLNCILALGLLNVCCGNLEPAYGQIKTALDGFREIYSPTHTEAQSALLSLCYYFNETMACQSHAELDGLEAELKQANQFLDAWAGDNCHGCYVPIQGSYFACAECPNYTLRFCRSCVALIKPSCFCDHGSSLASFIPPARLLQEKRLTLLAQEVKWPEYNTQYQVYAEFCSINHVPEAERLHCVTPRSIPRL
ncbi:Aste57867_11728 [Aphanomyces stellatus]|uniref:Aste57867_11728 protein n=1 Tax=Aphanomyces stellatus TaxID=120398 RepID=A0A485KUB2_9STRA|nr:hypothetical protein As57867_011684 [Aphanomyces stellatus]VFT88585.1 Aste57867_11728 [Aphanomyces stellatus]